MHQTPAAQNPSMSPRPQKPDQPGPDDNMVAPQVPRAFLTLAVVIIGFAVSVVMVPFWAPIFLGATLAAATSPFYHKLLRHMPGWPKGAALLTVLAILMVVVAPVLACLGYAAIQMREGASWLGDLLATKSLQQAVDRLPRLAQEALFRVLRMADLQLDDVLTHVQLSTQMLRDWLPQLLGTSLTAVATWILALVTCSVALVEHKRIRTLSQECLPLKRADAQDLMHHLRKVSTGSLLGLGCTAISHSLVIGVALWLAGVPHAAFFGILALFAAFVPVVGSALLYAPVALVFGLVQQPWRAVALVVGCFVGSQLLDVLLKPLAQRGRMPLHGALAFFSVIGGLTLFGLIGTVVGPMAMVAATSLFQIYHRDYIRNTAV